MSERSERITDTVLPANAGDECRPATFEFNPAAAADADILLTAEPTVLYRRLLRDQESETVLMTARRILHGFLSRHGIRTERPAADPDAIAAWVDEFRQVIMALLEDLAHATPAAWDAVLRQRAPVALLDGCWLDVVSQPATQPARIVNRLLEHQFVLRGEGNPRRAQHHLRQLSLEKAGVYLPEIVATDFLRIADARPLTVLHGAFYLSLAKLPANFLPEVVGVHYASTALGVDDQLLGMRPMLAEPELWAVLADYLAAAPELGERVVRAVELVATLELEHAGMLVHLAAWRDGRRREAAPGRVGERAAAARRQALAVPPPKDVALRPAAAPDHRRFLHRLVNIENYPNTLTLAREHATVVLNIAEEMMFEHGGFGTVTDASWFDYTPDALRERVDRVCRDKAGIGHNGGGGNGSLGPVVTALAGLTSGACVHRIGAVGRYTKPSDGALYSCYAEAMGVGRAGVNQVAHAYHLLDAMGRRVPHIGSTAFLDPDVAPDFPCELAIHQLCLALHPDTFYAEILGFQLGVTISGLSGVAVDGTAESARRSAAVIVDYLDGVSRTCGWDVVRVQWRRIWRGYASFAYLVEPEPLGGLVVDAIEPTVRPGTNGQKVSNANALRGRRSSATPGGSAPSTR